MTHHNSSLGLRHLSCPLNFDGSRPDCRLQHSRMPLYEFRCPDGHEFEKFYRSIGTASAGEKCPVCGKVSERLMSMAGLVFKGSGFYITDYGKDGKKAEREAATSAASLASAASAKSEKAEGGEKPAKSESASESKPASGDSSTPKSESTAPAPASIPKAESKPAPAPAPKATPGKDA